MGRERHGEESWELRGLLILTMTWPVFSHRHKANYTNSASYFSLTHVTTTAAPLSGQPGWVEGRGDVGDGL